MPDAKKKPNYRDAVQLEVKGLGSVSMPRGTMSDEEWEDFKKRSGSIEERISAALDNTELPTEESVKKALDEERVSQAPSEDKSLEEVSRQASRESEQAVAEAKLPTVESVKKAIAEKGVVASPTDEAVNAAVDNRLGQLLGRFTKPKSDTSPTDEAVNAVVDNRLGQLLGRFTKPKSDTSPTDEAVNAVVDNRLGQLLGNLNESRGISSAPATTGSGYGTGMMGKAAGMIAEASKGQTGANDAEVNAAIDNRLGTMLKGLNSAKGINPATESPERLIGAKAAPAAAPGLVDYFQETLNPSNIKRLLVPNWAIGDSELAAELTAGVAPNAPAAANAPVATDASANVPASVLNAGEVAAPAPSGASGSVTARTKTTKPGTAPAVAATPKQDEIRQAYEAQLFAQNAAADLESKALKDKAALLGKQEEEMLKLEVRRANAEQVREGRMRQAQDGLVRLQSRFAELESQSPDPNRFWNNKSDGQKAAAVIAGALFGFTGQGMQWLQRLDSLVAQDVEQQAAELRRREGLVGKQIDVQNNLVALARQQGLDEIESVNAARMMMKEKYALQLEAVAASTGSEMVKAGALEKAAALRAGYVKDERDFTLRAKSEAASNALKYAQAQRMRAEAEESYLKMTQAAAGGKPKSLTELKPGQQERLADLLTLGKKIGEMKSEYDKKAGSFYSPVAAQLGLGMQATEASKWKGSSQKFYAQTIGTTLEGGKLTDADFSKYSEGFIPSASDTSGAAKNKTENLIKYAVDKYRSELQTLAAGNFYIAPGELPSPAEYEQELRRQAGLSSAPTYATPR